MKKTKIVILILLLLSIIQQSKAQTTIDSVNYQLRDLFQNLDKPSPPKDFNWDMAAHLVDSSLFVTTNYTDTLNVDNWLSMYTEMRNSAYDTSTLAESDSVIYPNYMYQPDTINILAMYYDYYRFKPDALDSNIYFNFDTVNNILTDKYPRPSYPYNEYSVFAASPVTVKTNRSHIVYRIGMDNFLTDSFHLMDTNFTANGYKLRVNFHEGSGWHYLTPGIDNYVTIDYTIGGKNTIQMQVEHKQFGIIANSISSIHIKTDFNGVLAGILDFPTQRLHQFGMNINIYEPCDTNQNHTKTLIYLEGFDVMDFLPFISRQVDDIYHTQIRQTGLSDLRNFGYRIMVVDWENSRQDINTNADNLIALLDHLKCGNIVGDNNDEQFVIMGESMGGIVANLAMLKMENGHISPCETAKEHNVRLLINLDVPYQGAHLPMSIQLAARWLRNNAALGFYVPSMAFKLLFKAEDLFLDGDAAKQLLHEHVGTQSLFGPLQYYPHNKRDDLLQQMFNLGDRPQHCKIVAASNGNMEGFGQTRYWDGAPRTAGDALLHNQTLTHGTVLRQQFNFFGSNIELNTNPNGIGDMAKISGGSWFIKLKLKWFGIKFYTGFNILVNKDWIGYTRGVSTSSGGLLDYNGEVRTSLLDNKQYQGNGEWTTTSNHKWGTNTTARTDGFHWCFVPVTSAFQSGFALNVPYDFLGVNNILTNSPFSLVYGVPGTQQRFAPSNLIFDFRRNVYIRNDHHTDMRNDTLRDPINIPFPHLMQYDAPCSNISGIPHIIRMLNREIGDDSLMLENHNFFCHASFSIPNYIAINERSKYYEYPSGVGIYALPSVYSRENPFNIDITNGLANFTTVTGNVQYNAPFSGAYTTPSYTIVNCCENYYKGNPNNTIMSSPPKKKEIILYPNPTTNNFILKFEVENKGLLQYKIINTMGQTVYTGYKNIEVVNTTYHLPITLPSSITQGNYIVLTQFNGNTFTNKLTIN